MRAGEERARKLEGQITKLEECCHAAEIEKAKLQEEVNLFSAVKDLINRRESSV